MKSINLLAAICLIFATACNSNKETMPRPPVAKKIPTNLEKHGDVRVDNYYWLNDRENPEVIDYLNQENDYYDEVTKHTKDFQNNLFEEIKSRIKEDDTSVPYFYNQYWYYTRFETGKQYPIFCRKKGNLESVEEVMFNVNEMAEGHDYFQLNGIEVSPDNTLAAFGVDTVSRRQYTLRIKNLITGEIYPDKIDNTTGGSNFANDNKTLFYTLQNPTTLRSEKIMKHKLGETADKDQLVFFEEDETYNTWVDKSKSEQYIFIGSYSTLTSEMRFVNADTPDDEFKIFQPRTRGLEYDVNHYGDKFYIVTNADNATNFKLMSTPITATGKSNWKDIISHRADVLLEGIDIFKDYLVVSERYNGLKRIHIKRWDNSNDYYLPFGSETYSANTSTNLDFNTTKLRYVFNDMTTPSSVIEFDMATQDKTVLKEQEVLGGKFDKNNYTSKRIWATATDGTKVAISLVYRKDTKLNKETPLLLYGYGSYGITLNPSFSTTRLSLLDRGFVYAIAHVRGGQYLGRPWYEDGKLLKKKNTFTDFIDCSKFLIAEGYTSTEHLYAMGGSAGGLLMGAVVNMAPELYNGVIAAVPFVDVVTTMLDDSIPLTTGEYDEWGNPNELEYYNFIKTYSPYDNVADRDYPNMLVTTGLHDSQVQYWEPAKWVAKLREHKTDDNILLLHTNMEAGHGGASGRFEALKEVAQEYAFILDLEGRKE
ncbi:MAG: S9 family peptidase [Bacteroidetes bacterium]|nr:S9 family peptidase [Bacteroidota bacterium]MDA0879173.1 S9 family peptidase [Bacteroidota bacterium]MDA1115038.1 S9 family peptidase [Bacteroidota bacterium]